jgi:Zinc finger, C3HC4 type (RING finger)
MEYPESEVVLCAKCEDNPDDILILTCEHNLCLTCAAKNLHEQEQKQKNSFSVISLKYLNYNVDCCL